MYPYVEQQRVWGHELKLNVVSVRTEDWFGSAGFVRRRRGDFAQAAIDMNKWNPHLRAMIKPGNTVIDCGANEGWVTCIFAKQVGPLGRVIAIEPDSENIERIKANLALNDLHNVTVMHRAVGTTSGEVLRFAVERVVDEPVPGHRNEDVLTVSIDDLAASGKPDVIKIDIEAWELAALRGASKTLAAGALWEIEMHLTPGEAHMTEWFGFDPAEIMDILQRQHGYTVRIDGRVLEPGEIPGHGAMWAHRGERIVHAEREGASA